MDRVVYEDHNHVTHEVATLDDGLKFIGDDSTATPVTKKLNDTLQICGDGTYDKDKNTVADDGNIKTSVDNGAVKVSLSDKINLHQGGYLTVGGDTREGQDPILIKNFGAGDLTVTGKDKDGNTPQSKAGDYVSGRAATEDQLKKISDTIKSNAETAAGQHTEITVNDKKAPTIVPSDKVGTTDYGDYVGGNDNLLIAAKKDTKSGKTIYNIKLNDQLVIGQKGEQGEPGKPGTPGKDGKVTVETKGGTTVIIGHDGKDGDNGKDGLFVTGPKGKDGKDGNAGVSITGPNGQDGIDGKIVISAPGKDGQPGKDAVSISGQNGEGHIGLTGPAGKDSKYASADIHVKNGQNGVDGTDGNNGKDGMDRVVYEDHNGTPHEVATMDDGLKFVGNDGKEVTKKLNSTLSLTGGMDKDAVAKASSKNLGVRQNASKDGINGGDKQITNVASGASEIIKDADGKVSYKYDNETNAANIGDVKRIAGDMKTEITNNVTDVTNKMGDELTQVQKDVKADRTYQGDDGAAKKVKVKFGSFLSLTGGAKLADLTEEGNIGVVQKEIDDPDNKGKKIAGLSVRLAKYLNLEKTTYTSNENGQTYTSEIDGKGLTIKTGDENRNITVQDGNVNMGGNKIESVAPGKVSKESTDAVNGSQLFATNQTVANLGGAVNKLGTRVNRVGAGAAALAALHPLDFDPDDKWDFAAGYGNYKDASAVAVGAYYRPNEDTMFSVGGSFGGGENMVNAGVSFKVGQGNHVSTSRVAMAKEIKDLRQDVANLNAIVNRQSALIDKLTGTNAGTIQDTGNDLFPDVPATTGLMNTSPS